MTQDPTLGKAARNTARELVAVTEAASKRSASATRVCKKWLWAEGNDTVNTAKVAWRLRFYCFQHNISMVGRLVCQAQAM